MQRARVERNTFPSLAYEKGRQVCCAATILRLPVISHLASRAAEQHMVAVVMFLKNEYNMCKGSFKLRPRVDTASLLQYLVCGGGTRRRLHLSNIADATFDGGCPNQFLRTGAEWAELTWKKPANQRRNQRNMPLKNQTGGKMTNKPQLMVITAALALAWIDFLLV